MSDDWYDADDDNYQEMAAEARWQRRQQAQLLSNPDCRDPDHPGCAICDNDPDDNEEYGDE
jgi:hypothetical protein